MADKDRELTLEALYDVPVQISFVIFRSDPYFFPLPNNNLEMIYLPIGEAKLDKNMT